MKGETYKHDGRSWLVWRDKNGEKELDIWTTSNEENVPNHRFKMTGNQLNHNVIYIDFEVTKFPNGKYGFGFKSNFLEVGYEKVKCDFYRSYETEISCLQHALEYVVNRRKNHEFNNKVLRHFMEYLESQINPKTLF